MPVVQRHVPLHDGQPEPHAGALARPAAGKAFEHPRPPAGRDAGPGVVDHDAQAVRARLDPHAGAPAAVGLGVPDEVRDDPLEASLVDLHHQPGHRRVDRRHDPPGGGIGGPADEIAHPHGLPDHLVAGVVARDLQEVDDQGAEPFQLVRQQLDRLPRPTRGAGRDGSG